ncbi:MAG TPA: hypothetical protein VMY76_07455 [Gemmatimonadales bacterium]|nr:hypothetical protein [Gemmatimonadales bacterium]
MEEPKRPLLLLHRVGAGRGRAHRQAVQEMLAAPEGRLRQRESRILGVALAYAVTFAVIAVLYPLCRWFAGVKRRRRDPWLSYL